MRQAYLCRFVLRLHPAPARHAPAPQPGPTGGPEAAPAWRKGGTGGDSDSDPAQAARSGPHVGRGHAVGREIAAGGPTQEARADRALHDKEDTTRGQQEQGAARRQAAWEEEERPVLASSAASSTPLDAYTQEEVRLVFVHAASGELRSADCRPGP